MFNLSEPDLPPSVAETMRLMGRKWAVNILFKLMMEPSSFGELQDALKGISSSVLSDLLQTFTKNFIVEKRIISVSPERSAYFLTEFGDTFCKILENIMEWGENLMKLRENVNVDRLE